jgi:hypothetical protein
VSKLSVVANQQPPPPAFLRVLAEIETMRSTMRVLEFEVIHMMREVGFTWEAIGDELGLTRQAARSRFTQPRSRRHE